MEIRTFQAGDETVQVEIYNEAAAALPHFKPATVHEVKRRTSGRDFDPATQFFALEGGQVVGYCRFHANGRVSFPWCKRGHEACREALFERVMTAMKERQLTQAFAAYRPDWPTVAEFFTAHGFQKVREMINYLQGLLDMPTMLARPSNRVAPVRSEDIPALFQMAPEVLHVKSPQQFEEHLLRNPYFPPEAIFVLRGKINREPVGAGVLILEPTYADPATLDPLMPCFRLGAFGTEFMQTKRINGLFSVLARADENFPTVTLDLLGHALYRIQDHDDVETLSAQVPSDAPHLVHFYERNFERQGSFPVFERSLQ